MKFANSRFHFLGIGGIGMSGLAELLHKMGATVSGTDMKENEQTKRLQAMGIKIYLGHKAENVQDCDVVVYSSAVKNDNPEMLEAKRRHIPRIPRAEALAEIMNLKRGLAVAGTHGKTTTTSFVSSIFVHAMKEPTIAVGGRLDLIQSTALLGKGEWMIAEADESDGSFSRLNHEICIVTNIDNDHLDYYKSMEALKKAFYDFALKVPFYGAAVVCGDDPLIREIYQDFPKKIIYYGMNKNNDFYLEGKNGEYTVFDKQGKNLGMMKLQLAGTHNALNALSAVIASHLADVPWDDCLRGAGMFKGVDRRFQLRGEKSGVLIYDDYGHHPTEVRATLQAFREKYPSQNIYVLFQPHRYSRTQLCWKEFTESFSVAKKVWLLDVYAAGEKPLPDVDSQRLAQEIQEKKGEWVGQFATAKEKVLSQCKAGDVVVCLGAGDVNKFFDLL
ncbi:UDP-N-acetylmuramate--L-alanine ligase [bacterium]|nr:UDP-N-acetylmuramate--L-alanine ligase [bacterium]